MASPELIQNELEAELVGLSRQDRAARLQAVWTEGNRRIAEADEDPVRAQREGLWHALEPVHVRTEHAARLLERMGEKPARAFPDSVNADVSAACAA